MRRVRLPFDVVIGHIQTRDTSSNVLLVASTCQRARGRLNASKGEAPFFFGCHIHAISPAIVKLAFDFNLVSHVYSNKLGFDESLIALLKVKPPQKK